MFRIPHIALITLALAVPASAQSKPVDLETVAVKIMLKAFEFGDYDTVETLFEKLPLESKKQFLHQAAEIATVNVRQAVIKSDGDLSTLPFTDMMYMSMFAMLKIGEIGGDLETRVNVGELANQIFEAYAHAKTKQMQLLGRLTVSLIEQSAVADSSDEE